jgi:hypothetical protein
LVPVGMLLVKLETLITLPLGPVRFTELVGRLTEKVMLGAPETDTVEGVPAPESRRLIFPVLDLKPVLWGAITTVPAEVSGTKVPKPKVVAELMVRVLATVAEADTEYAGVVTCAQPMPQAPMAARATLTRVRHRNARAEPNAA